MSDGSARWRRVEDLCHAALARDASERRAFIATACGDDQALRREVEALLAHAPAADDFLATPIGAVAADVMSGTTPVTWMGRRIGVYEIVSPLGAGGMGEVYRARDTQLGRDVALKVLPQAFVADRIQSVNALLGDEIVFCASVVAGANDPLPMVMARVQPGRRAELAGALNGLFADAGESPASFSVSATKAALNEAIAFQQAIGIERKAARLRYLTLRWANELKKLPKVKLHSSLEAGQTWGLAVVSINGVDTNKLVTHLWDKYRIVITAVGHNNEKVPAFSYRGLRVTPNIYTPLEEIDTFVEAMTAVANGLISTL